MSLLSPRSEPIPQPAPSRANDEIQLANAVGWPDTDHPKIDLLRNGTEEEKQRALLQLYRAYEKPVRRYIQFVWSSLSTQDAEDIASRFYEESLVGPKAHFLTYNKDSITKSNKPARLRTYFQVILDRDLSNHHRAVMTLKRGGAIPHEPLDTVSPDVHQSGAMEAKRMSFAAFDRVWANHMLEMTLSAVKAHSKPLQHIQQYFLQILRQELTDDNLAIIAKQVGMSHNAVRTAASRLSHRWKLELRKIVLRTLESPDDLEDEMAYLREVLVRYPVPELEPQEQES